MTLELLVKLGYGVAQAEDASKALKILSGENHIDLLLTDVVLGGDMAGPELARQMKQQDKNSKVLFMTGHSGANIFSEQELTSAITLLQKPFGLADLATKVRVVLDEGRQPTV